MKFRIYIDEVGNPDLESSDDLNHRFLSLTGIVLEDQYTTWRYDPYHSSRNEILCEKGFTEVSIAPFAQKVIAIIQSKYYHREGIIYGKKFL
jgi:hypothetical protein